jgi:hypothetical protein
MLVLLVLASVVAVVWGALRNDGDQPAGKARTAPSAKTSAQPSPAGSPTAAAAAVPPPATAAPDQPSPEASPPPDRPGIPAGWTWHQDATGFGIAIPAGWRVERGRQGHIYVRDPGSERFLLIDQTTDPKPDAVADWRHQEAARKGTIRDYHGLGIRHVDGYFTEAADWEFTHTSDRGTPLHVISRGFVTSPHQAYGLYWSTPANMWNQSYPLFKTFTSTFKPRP